MALNWSPGRICATDWILKYTPTPSRLFRKRLKLDEQCLARDYECDISSDVFNTGTFTDLEGPLCSLMPFSNCNDSELETYDRFKRSKIKIIIVAV